MSTPTEPGKVQRSLFVCTTPRSRSTFFAEALRQTGVLGVPAEWFNDYLFDDIRAANRLTVQSDAYAQLEALIKRATDDRGVFAVKAIDEFFFRFCHDLRTQVAAPEDVPTWDLIRERFPNPHFIFWQRESKLRQAISYDKAQQGGRWHSFEKIARPASNLVYDGFYLRWIIERMEKAEQEWREFLNGTGAPVLELSDEELLADYRGTIKRVLEFVGENAEDISIDPSQNSHEEVSDAVNSTWSELYEEGVRLGFPSDFAPETEHWSNLTHRMWIELETVSMGDGQIVIRGTVRNLKNSPFTLMCGNEPARVATVRARWVRRVNPLQRPKAADHPIPVTWVPGETAPFEIVVNDPHRSETHDLYLVLLVRGDLTWVRLNGVNTPLVNFS